jgi:hypothetical protein
MATVSVRYIVDDVDAAIDFYCQRLGAAPARGSFSSSPGWVASKYSWRTPLATRSSCSSRRAPRRSSEAISHQ